MNKKQLMTLGVPTDCIREAIGCVQNAAAIRPRLEDPKKLIPKIVAAPEVSQLRKLRTVQGRTARRHSVVAW